MKIYQRLEQILKFRIYSNKEIPEYLKRMSNMGKLDDVKKIALLSLILTVLGEMEDREDSTPPSSIGTYTIPIVKGSETPLAAISGSTGYICPECNMLAKSKIGLLSHTNAKHKKVI